MNKNQSPKKAPTFLSQKTHQKGDKFNMMRYDSEVSFSDANSNKSDKGKQKQYLSLRSYLYSKVANPIVETKKEDLLAAKKIQDKEKI